VIRVGIDPGSRSIGLAAVHIHGLLFRLADSCTVRIKGKAKADRLVSVEAAIVKFLKRHQPAEVVVERGYIGPSPQSALLLAEARGVAILAAAKSGADVIEVTPAQIRKTLGLKPSDGKVDVQFEVSRKFSAQRIFAPDEADALAMAIYDAE
jgi:crossover junction endodeoxyribonuclease RuvC